MCAFRILEKFWAPDDCRESLEREIFSAVKSGETLHVVFFTGYLNANYYHLYQLIQLARLQKLGNIHLHIVLSYVVNRTKRHTGYSEDFAVDPEKMNEVYLQEISTVLQHQGVPSQNIHLYKFSNLWMKTFSQRKDLLINFYQGLNEIPNDILSIESNQSKKFTIPKNSQYTIGYVIQKYATLFLLSHFSLIEGDDLKGGKVLHIIGDSGRPIVSRLQKELLRVGIIPPVPYYLYLDAIPTFGTDKKKTPSFSIPKSGMPSEDIGRVAAIYHVSASDVAEIYQYFITPITRKIFDAKKEKMLTIFAQDMHDAFRDVLGTKIHPTELTVAGIDEIVQVGAILRSPIAIGVLHLCDGSRSISEIAKEMNRHVSNISVTIRQLKDANLLTILPNGKPLRQKGEIKIILH